MRYLACILILCSSAFAETYKVQSSLRLSPEITVTCHGNAFAVTKNTAVTCAHVVGGKAETRIQVKGAWLEAKILRKDEANDLCLLQVAEDVLEPVEFAPAAVVITVGAQRNEEIKTHAVELKGGKLKSDYTVGISGSPVFADGKLVGMVVSIDSADQPTESHFVSSVVIRKFLDNP